MKYFSIVRLQVLSESENRRFTSTDFDADLQAFKHEKSPMKSDFFGQISFLSPQYGFLIRNDYTTILNHKPLFLNASRPSKILRSYTPTFLSNFITIATLTQICNTRLRIRKNANIKKNKKILNKSIGQMSFKKEKILFLILLFYFFRFLVRQEK